MNTAANEINIRTPNIGIKENPFLTNSTIADTKE